VESIDAEGQNMWGLQRFACKRTFMPKSVLSNKVTV